MGLAMSRPDLDELECLTPPDDLPDDARITVTAGDLRALVSLVPAAREIIGVFGTLERPEQEART
jgi:hypothetical protein